MAASLTETILTPATMDSLKLRPNHAPGSSIKRVQQTQGARLQRAILETPDGSPSQRQTKSSGRLDPAALAEPTRKKLSTIEAQRIMAVVDETIRRVTVASLLPSVLDGLDNLKVCLGAELVQLLERHTAILDSFEEMQSVCGRYAKSGSQSMPRSAASVRSVRSRTTSGKMRGSTTVEGQPILDENYVRSQTEREDSNKAHRDDRPSRGSTGLEGCFPEGEPDNQESYQPSPDGDRSMEAGLPDQLSPLGDNNTNAERDEWPDDMTPTRADSAARNLSLLAAEMQDSCRNILRAFTANHAAVTEIQRTDRSDSDTGAPSLSPEAEEVIQYLNELREFIRAKLLTTPIEELERTKYLRELSDKERYNDDVIAKLSAELKAAEDEMNDEISQQNGVIRRLQEEIHQIEKNSEENIQRTKQEGQKQESAEKKISEEKQSRVQVELNQTQAQYNSLLAEHREKEMALRKRKFQVESEVENWIQKFDADMGERQDEYEQIDFVYTEEKKQLNELEERFKSLEVEYLRILEARRHTREVREAAERELQMCVRAATTIQAFWRSFKVRRAIKNKKKKAKGSSKKSTKY